MIVVKNAVSRKKGHLYYLKGTDVWSYNPKTKAKTKEKSLDFERDNKKYLYFIDKAGNVARAPQKRRN